MSYQMWTSRQRLLAQASAFVIASVVVTTPAFAQEDSGEEASTMKLQTVTVTAQKRTENLQDVPASLQVLDGSQLAAQGVTNFEDYVALLPSVSFAGQGPGNSQVFMRGISSGGDGNKSGSSPSVAVYLDDQPVTTIGRVLDVHMYDIARVEAVAGPQGTLYGAGSQAGTLRIITNAPSSAGFESGYDLSVGTTKEGSESYSAEGFVNLPIGEKAALRIVGWMTAAKTNSPRPASQSRARSADSSSPMPDPISTAKWTIMSTILLMPNTLPTFHITHATAPAPWTKPPVPIRAFSMTATTNTRR